MNIVKPSSPGAYNWSTSLQDEWTLGIRPDASLPGFPLPKLTSPIWPGPAGAGLAIFVHFKLGYLRHSLVKSYLGTNRRQMHSDPNVLCLRQHVCLKDLQVMKDTLSTPDFPDHDEELTESICMYCIGGFQQ